MRVKTGIRLVGLPATAVAAASACTPVAVYVEHGPQTDFSALTAFDWNAPADAPAGDSEVATLDTWVREAVERELVARGFQRRTDGTADFLVGYTAAVNDEVRAETINRYAGYVQSSYLAQTQSTRYFPRDTIGRQTATYSYQQGSLILDVSLPEPKRLIWRAYARAVIDPNDSEGHKKQVVGNAVRRMLKDFPP